MIQNHASFARHAWDVAADLGVEFDTLADLEVCRIVVNGIGNFRVLLTDAERERVAQRLQSDAVKHGAGVAS